MSIVCFMICAEPLVRGAGRLAPSFGIFPSGGGSDRGGVRHRSPDLAVSVQGVLIENSDISAGNLVGSNTFSIACVLGLSSLVAPSGIAVPPSMLSFDIPPMVGMAIACLLIFLTDNRITRWEGGVLLAAYVTNLVMAANNHDALSSFGPALIWIVLPAIMLTLVVVSWRQWRSRNSESPTL